MEITVKYWRGTTQFEGVATTYAGAMRIAARNQNAYNPTFWDGELKLIDDGNGLAYDDKLDSGKVEYAVLSSRPAGLK
jgi:hypothetical protein